MHLWHKVRCQMGSSTNSVVILWLSACSSFWTENMVTNIYRNVKSTLKKERHLLLAAHLVHATPHLLDKCVSFPLGRNTDLSVKEAVGTCRRRTPPTHPLIKFLLLIQPFHSAALHRWENNIDLPLPLSLPLSVCMLCAVDFATHQRLMKIRLLKFMIILMYLYM